MKRSCIFILLCIFVFYLKEGYELVTADAPVKCAVTGNLSDVAEEVTAIPLETNLHCQLGHVHRIKRDGNHLFLLSKHQLYHFSCSGKFINQITYTGQSHKNSFTVSDYVVDPIHKQLIVMDDKLNAHYFNYEGDYLGRIDLSKHRTWNSLFKLSYYDNHLYATAERQIQRKEAGNRYCVEQWLYKFDTTFNEVETRRLTNVELGRFTLEQAFAPEVAVVNQQVYVQSPAVQPDLLLRDTLYLINQNKLDITDDYPYILPIRINKRFLISTHYNAQVEEKSYTFCFDRLKNQAYNVAGGLTDNFYQTGNVPELQPMDINSNYYCYCKTGKDVEELFPERTTDSNPVLFIIKLKA